MIEIDRYLYCEEEEERKKISHRISQSLAGYRVIKKKKKIHVEQRDCWEQLWMFPTEWR